MSKSILSKLAPPDELSADGVEHFKRYMRSVRSRRRSSAIFRISSLVIAVAAFVILFEFALAYFRLPAIITNDALGGAIMFAAAVMIIPYFYCMLSGTAAGRVRDLGVILLRPFGEPELTRALKRVIKETVGPLGCVYTLSDRSYKPNYLYHLLMAPWGVYGFVLSAVFRPSVRLGHVGSPRGLEKLEYFALKRNGRLSFWSFISGEQAFNFSSTDDWWQTAIRSLAKATDMAVMDISKVGAGSTWEIDYLKSTGRWQMCVFIVQEEFSDAGSEILLTALGSDRPVILNVYRHDGTFVEPDQISECLKAAIINGLLWRRAVKRTLDGAEFYLEDWRK